jgi:carbon storage regulator
MLILSRRKGESLMVGDDVVITVLDVKGDHVRLGVTAPPATAVHREEVYRKVNAGASVRFRPPKQRGLDARLHR